MSKILLSPEAQNDLHEIRRYITEELRNPAAADNTLGKIIKRIRTLADFPQGGSPLSAVVHFETLSRFLVCGNYLAFYRIDEDNVFIDRILYGRRDYLSILFGKLPEGDE